jgi:hypothetical protein
VLTRQNNNLQKVRKNTDFYKKSVFFIEDKQNQTADLLNAMLYG